MGGNPDDDENGENDGNDEDENENCDEKWWMMTNHMQHIHI